MSEPLNLVPQSITAINTNALDATFAERLANIGIGQLLIDLANERDMFKLTLYLQQFGIPTDVLPSDMTDFEFRKLLQNILRIYRLSGTTESITSLALALGASSATIIGNAFTLDHNRQARHNTAFLYNQGREYRSFAVDVKVVGVGLDSRTTFETSFRKLFRVFQPINIYLRHIYFYVTL